MAERSKNSAREIATFVEAVQKDTNQAVGLTQGVLRQIVDAVTKTMGLVGEVYTAAQAQDSGVAKVLRISLNMQQASQELAHAAKEQSKGAREIMKAVEAMNEMTRQVAHAAKEQSNGAGEIMKAVEAMTRSTQQVAHATAEQREGSDKVVRAVEQIAQVAQQNLLAAEQLSEVVLHLTGEAERLKKLTEVFQV